MSFLNILLVVMFGIVGIVLGALYFVGGLLLISKHASKYPITTTLFAFVWLSTMASFLIWLVTAS